MRKTRFLRHPAMSVIVIVDRFSDREVIKRIKPAATTRNIVHQHHARDPDVFVYRVNVYNKHNQF